MEHCPPQRLVCYYLAPVSQYSENLNPKDIMIKDLESRPHALSPSLAAAGVKEYRLTQEFVRHIDKNKTESSVKVAADLTAS